MLAGSTHRNLMSEDWEAAVDCVQLPESMRDDFLEKRGPMPMHFENKRSFHRYYMRGKAILNRGEANFGVYTKDVSRQGIGLLSPVQLLPLEKIRLELADGSVLNLEVSRCRRLEKGCFDCGTRFVL